MKYFTSLVLCCLFFSNLNAQVSCTDCPNADFIGGILISQINVVNPGPDDIGQNLLTDICVNIQHAWLSDVALSLESPDGLNYVLMADEDNNWGGCQGVGVANADICFTIGNSNPLTDGQPYQFLCNGNNGACLEGDFTPACSGVAYTPDYLAFPAPNCDILDYSIPGNTISGLWTLRLYCVCPDLELGAGALIDWSLNFQDASNLSNGSTNPCFAFAGTQSTETVMEVCESESQTVVFDAISTNGQVIPDGNGFHYGVIAIQNNIITEFSEYNEVETEAWEIGTYTLKGISYHEDAINSIQSMIGYSYSSLEVMQGEVAGGLCFALSDFEMSVEVTIPTEMIEIYTLCEGSSLDIYGTVITEIGDYAFESNIGEACNAIVYVEVQPDDAISFERIYPRVCEGEMVEMTAENGMSYLWVGPNGFTSTEQTVVLNNPDVNTSGTYTCEVTSFEGCVGNQVTELSLRCETRPIEIELGQSVTFDFDQIVGEEDECQNTVENIAEVYFTASSIIISAESEGEEEICFQAYENGFLKNITYLVNVGTPNAVFEPEVNLEIFPNPASNYLQLNANGVLIEQVSFFDTKGALVKNVFVNDSKSEVVIEDLTLALYILKIKTTEGTLVRKLIIE